MLSLLWVRLLMLLFDDVKDDGAVPLSQFSLSLLLWGELLSELLSTSLFQLSTCFKLTPPLSAALSFLLVEILSASFVSSLGLSCDVSDVSSSVAGWAVSCLLSSNASPALSTPRWCRLSISRIVAQCDTNIFGTLSMLNSSFCFSIP